jgi:hypothetical protein
VICAGHGGLVMVWASRCLAWPWSGLVMSSLAMGSGGYVLCWQWPVLSTGRYAHGLAIFLAFQWLPMGLALLAICYQCVSHGLCLTWTGLAWPWPSHGHVLGRSWVDLSWPWAGLG